MHSLLRSESNLAFLHRDHFWSGLDPKSPKCNSCTLVLFGSGGPSHIYRVRLCSCSKISESGSKIFSNLRIGLLFKLRCPSKFLTSAIFLTYFCLSVSLLDTGVKRNFWLAKFLSSHHVRMHRVIFFTLNALIKLIIRA